MISIGARSAMSRMSAPAAKTLSPSVITIHHVLAVAHPPLPKPLRHVAQEVGHAIEVIEDDHSLQQRTVDEDRAEVRAGARLVHVVLRDQADERDTRVDVDALEHGLEHGAA